MPRNRYPKLIRRIERAQIASQVKQLTALTWKLRRPELASETVLLVLGAKERRRNRLEQNSRHKPKRRDHPIISQQ